MGRRPSSKARPERPANIVEAATWADAAAYLADRLHVAPGEVANTPGHEQRKPDMGPAAGAAMRAVLAEMGAERRVTSRPQDLILTLKTVSRPTRDLTLTLTLTLTLGHRRPWSTRRPFRGARRRSGNGWRQV